MITSRISSFNSRSTKVECTVTYNYRGCIITRGLTLAFVLNVCVHILDQNDAFGSFS